MENKERLELSTKFFEKATEFLETAAMKKVNVQLLTEIGGFLKQFPCRRTLSSDNLVVIVWVNEGITMDG